MKLTLTVFSPQWWCLSSASHSKMCTVSGCPVYLTHSYIHKQKQPSRDSHQSCFHPSWPFHSTIHSIHEQCRSFTWTPTSNHYVYKHLQTQTGSLIYPTPMQDRLYKVCLSYQYLLNFNVLNRGNIENTVGKFHIVYFLSIHTTAIKPEHRRHSKAF